MSLNMNSEFINFIVIDSLNPSFELALETCPVNQVPPSPFDEGASESIGTQMYRRLPEVWMAEPSRPIYNPDFVLGLVMLGMSEAGFPVGSAPIPSIDSSDLRGATQSAHRAGLDLERSPSPSALAACRPCRSQSVSSSPGSAGPSAGTDAANLWARHSPDSGYASGSSSPVPRARSTGAVRTSPRLHRASRQTPYSRRRSQVVEETSLGGPSSSRSSVDVTMGSRSVPCRVPGCGELVSPTKDSVDKHLRSHKQDFAALTEVQGTIKVKCPWEDGCATEPMGRENLSRHMHKHFGSNKHECDICGAVISRAETLNRHQQSQHCQAVAAQHASDEAQRSERSASPL